MRIEWVLSDARADLIADGIDVALRTGNLRDSSLVASPAYLAARGTPQQLADLQHHDCITRHPAASLDTHTNNWRLQGPDGSIDVNVHGRLCANTMDAVLKATLAGLGVSLIPALLAQPLLASGQLLPVLPGYGVHGVGIHCVYPSRHQRPRAVSSFIAFTMDKIQHTTMAA